MRRYIEKISARTNQNVGVRGNLKKISCFILYVISSQCQDFPHESNSEELDYCNCLVATIGGLFILLQTSEKAHRSFSPNVSVSLGVDRVTVCRRLTD